MFTVLFTVSALLASHLTPLQLHTHLLETKFGLNTKQSTHTSKDALFMIKCMCNIS